MSSGAQSHKKFLVVMTNGDVCYLDKSTVVQLEKRIEEGENATFRTINEKTGAVTTIILKHVSTIVEEVRRG